MFQLHPTQNFEAIRNETKIQFIPVALQNKFRYQENIMEEIIWKIRIRT